MNPTQEQCNQLARVFAEGDIGEPERFDDYALSPRNCVATRDPIESFKPSQWRECGEQRQVTGGLFYKAVQVRKGDERVDLAVIDCGEFRLVYKH